MVLYSVCLSLTHFTQNNALQVHLCCSRWNISPLANGWVASQCVCLYTKHLLSPLICSQALRALPWTALISSAAISSGCKQLFDSVFSPNMCPGVGLLDQVVVLFFHFLRNFQTVFHNGCTYVHSNQQGTRVFFLSTSSPTFVICVLFDDSHSNQSVRWYFITEVSPLRYYLKQTHMLWLVFPWLLVMLSIFSCAYWSSAFPL